MAELIKSRYVFMLALLPYILAANAGLFVGWLCLNGSHLWESVDSRKLSNSMPGVPNHNPHHAKSLLEGIAQAAHCCACSASPTVEHSLADHATSWTSWSDPAYMSNFEGPLRDDPTAVLFRLASYCDPSRYGPDSAQASLHTVILLI